MVVYFKPYKEKQQAVSVACMAASLLLEKGAEVFMPQSLAKECSVPGVRFASEAQALEHCDVILTVGGDGTILHMALTAAMAQKPILGLNLGRTGFMATCELNELPDKLARLTSGSFELDSRMMLDAVVPALNQYKITALNDIVVYLGTHKTTMDFTLFCDGIQINHYRGDGVILSSPTGSTAYNLSAGGPILDARIHGIIATPICAHSLKSPPIVFSAERRLSLQVHSTDRDKVYICGDGFNERLLPSNCIIDIFRSDKTLNLIALEPQDQFKAIDSKLSGQ